jgi:hypothetical protein
MRLRAVTWISICIRGSDSPAEIIVAAGRTAPKYWRRTGQQSGKRGGVRHDVHDTHDVREVGASLFQR